MISYAQKRYAAGIYLRLSRDDEEQGESNSIASQRLILTQYAKSNGIAVYDEYVDDGWSGTNFERPGFKKMIGDIEAGKINCVITKDLSRLGRNYIITGQYTELYFPRHGVRYIAVDDNVDSMHGDNEIAPFKNIINEWYARDTSKKVKSAFKAKFADGQRTCMTAKFGYKKSSDQKGLIVPDEETMPIVQEIFSLAASGQSATQIVKHLKANAIPTPSWYDYKKEGLYSHLYDGVEDRFKPQWSVTTLLELLRDETYIGNTIHYRTGTISFKDKHVKRNHSDDWYRVEGTHEPIIDKDVFDKVQAALPMRKRTTASGAFQLFSGLLVCSDCGRNLSYGTSKRSNRKEYYYRCSRYSNVGKDACSFHYIRFKVIYAYVLSRIQYWTSQIANNEDAIIQAIEKLDGNSRSSGIEKLRRELKKAEDRYSQINELFAKMYEDRLDGKINEATFDMLSQKYGKEQGEVSKSIADYRGQIESRSKNVGKAIKWVDTMRKYTNPTELTREMLTELIDKIVVYNAVRTSGKRGEQRIEIYYRFVGSIENETMKV